MLRVSLAGLVSFVLLGTAAFGDSSEWKLVWADEFHGRGIPNPSNWNYHVGNGFNPGHFPQMNPDPAEFPLTMRVDYVRVYERRSCR